MRRTAGVLLVLLSMFGFAKGAGAQQDPTRPLGRQTSEFLLEQNYPNPFSTETRIPFTLGPELFPEGRPVVVSLRIYNLLLQFVAAPVALRHPAGDGALVSQLEYGQPGRHEARWDGRDQNGRLMISGIYWIQLTVNGVSENRKMLLSR